MPTDPCPGREISYLGRVSCRPIDALTRAILPMAAIGAAWGAMIFPGPQYRQRPMSHGVAAGAMAGGLFGGATTAVAYVNRATRSDVATLATAVVLFPLAFYWSFRIGAIPTA